jgi:hypothetical protein
LEAELGIALLRENFMKTAICTLFEGDYHKGVGVLINSLVRQGFKGTVFAGFRGAPPFWAAGKAKDIEEGAAALELKVTETVRVLFLTLDTKSHLTNYKPEFMLSLWRAYESDFDALLYLDPDIVVNENWSYFEDWLQCGVALCEDVNSPVHESHPRRCGWRSFYGKHGIQLRPRLSVYVNGGAVGVRKEDIPFIELWQQMTLLMADLIGGMATTRISRGQKFKSKGFANCFDIADQDSLNAAVEAYGGETSILGKEAMGLKPGHAILPHALGARKPWKCSYVLEAASGLPPRLVDKVFWRNAKGPIQAFDHICSTVSCFSLRIAAGIARFTRRS